MASTIAMTISDWERHGRHAVVLSCCHVIMLRALASNQQPLVYRQTQSFFRTYKYSRYGFRELVEVRNFGIIQPDVMAQRHAGRSCSRSRPWRRPTTSRPFSTHRRAIVTTLSSRSQTRPSRSTWPTRPRAGAGSAGESDSNPVCEHILEIV